MFNLMRIGPHQMINSTFAALIKYNILSCQISYQEYGTIQKEETY